MVALTRLQALICERFAPSIHYIETGSPAAPFDSAESRVVEVITFGVYDKKTAEERTIANAALGAGPWDSHDEIVIAVAHLLGLEAQLVEVILQRLRIRMVLVCVSAANATSETASVRYERGMDWMDGE
jgi:hypothetical protein